MKNTVFLKREKKGEKSEDFVVSELERDEERERDIQTDPQADGQTERQADGRTDRQ